MPAPPLKVAVCRPKFGQAYDDHVSSIYMLDKAEPGWKHFRHGGPCVDIVRSIIAESALKSGADVLLWIDADMVFKPEDAQALVRQAHELDTLVGALYVQKTFGADINVVWQNEEQKVSCFASPDAGLVEVAMIGFGMVAHPAGMLERIARWKDLPALQVKNFTLRPWFTCDFRKWETFHSDDYVFCRHARECGYKLYADSRIRVGHIGQHTYALEDAGGPLKRFDALDLKAIEKKEAAE